MSLDFIAGCAGGAAGVVVGHPLDTVKVRLQIQTADNIKYKGTFDCLRTTVKQEGVRGLYKGIASPLFGVAGVNALIFGVYGSLRPYVHGSPGNDALWAHFLAGSVSGAVQSFIASPMELVKTRMQVNEAAGTEVAKGPSSVEVLRGIYQREGGLFRGVFKGWGVTVAREIPGFGTYFATYEALTTKSGREVGTLGMMMAGGMAGVLSWIVTFPIDVVKTRLQSDTAGSYKGAVDCFKKTLSAEGYSAFTRGLGSTVIRAFPTNATTFTVVTWIMRWAESNRIDTVDDGKEYIKEILNESAKLQETLEGSLRVPMPLYLHEGNMSLGSSCAKVIKKYGHNTRDYFNFYDGSNIISSTITGGDTDTGLIKPRIMDAIKVDQQEKRDASLHVNLEETSSSFRVIEVEQVPEKEEGSPSSDDTPVTDGNPQTIPLLRRLLIPNLFSGKLKKLIAQLLDNFLPAIRLCSCWDDHCVCFS